MPKLIRFHFDYVSPNAYLAWTQLPRIAAEHGAIVEPVPVLFAGLLEAYGQLGPAEVAPKIRWMTRNNLRKAALLGVPLRPPAFHPFNPLLALRVSSLSSLAPAERSALVGVLLEAVWARGLHVAEASVVAQCARDVASRAMRWSPRPRRTRPRRASASRPTPRSRPVCSAFRPCRSATSYSGATTICRSSNATSRRTIRSIRARGRTGRRPRRVRRRHVRGAASARSSGVELSERSQRRGNDAPIVGATELGSHDAPWSPWRMQSPGPATLYFFCGKMAAGKSTLAREIVKRTGAILLVQDEWLAHLFPADVVDVPAFRKYSARLRDALTGHVVDLLSRGLTVVLDFPGNTRLQRSWFRGIVDRAAVKHELHFVVASDALCKAQLRIRSRDLADGAAWTSEAEFDSIAKFFEPPAPDEGFNVIRHERALGDLDQQRGASQPAR